MPKLVNKIIKILITSDFFLNLGWGLLGPVFAIFIIQKITGDIAKAAEVAGFASLIYWITKSLLQIPIGHYLDKNRGEKDDFWSMFLGELIIAFVPIGYLFSYMPWHIYVLQIIYAIGMSLAIPAWSAIFTRHIDKGKEAVQWSMESTFLGIGAGIAGGLGGFIVSILGFKPLFIFVSLLNIFSVLLLLLIRNDISPKNKEIIIMPIRPFVEP
ncbi:MAG: MFS transporter [Candidatus Staskawiczbacteria bacterium]|jgi:MFS family permease